MTKGNMKTCAALDRAEELKRILDSFDVLEIPGDVQKLVLQAVTDRDWDWFKRCDGCTCVSEAYWPTKYFPPCLRHDYDWQTGRGGWEANVRFFRIQRAYRMSAIVAGTRFVGVTVSWFAWFKWVSQTWSRRRLAAVLPFCATRIVRVRSS